MCWWGVEYSCDRQSFADLYATVQRPLNSRKAMGAAAKAHAKMLCCSSVQDSSCMRAQACRVSKVPWAGDSAAHKRKCFLKSTRSLLTIKSGL